MQEWIYAQRNPKERLARLHHFSVTKHQDGHEIEFLVTVKEYVPSKDESMTFFAQADKQTNQRHAPFTPTGWGSTLLKALSECIQSIHRFPYEGPEVSS